MAKTNKKVSVNKLQSLIEPNYGVIDIETENETFCVEFKRTLNLDEVIKFVDNVTSTVFGITEDNPEVQFYAPEYLDYMIRYCTLTMYANCSMPKNINSQYEILYGTEIYENIIREINGAQFIQIKDAIDRKISYILSSENSVKSSIDDIVKGIKSYFDNTQEEMGKYNLSDIIKFVDTVSNSEEFSSSNIVNAVLERHLDK